MWISKSSIRDLEDILEKITQEDSLDDFYFDEVEKGLKSKKIGSRLKKVFKTIRELEDSKESVKLGQESIVELNKRVLEYESITERMKFAISHICKHINAAKGVVYFLEDKKELKLYASYAFLKRDSSKTSYKIGEGIVGQVALEKEPILLRDLSEEDHKITTGSVVSNALQTYTAPLIYQDELFGVMEIATTRSLTDDELNFLDRSKEALSAIISIAKRYETTKQQAQDLEVQARELEQQTSEIEKQNQELESQTREIEESKKEIEKQNAELLASQEEIKRKVKELEESNQYKTDFLSNMSHELRTPLNSINILSGVLSKNREKNLSADQIKQLKTIHQAGNELLTLINDLLDLSKIDAQMMTLSLSNIKIKELVEDVFNIFEPLSEQSGIKLLLDIDKDVDFTVFSDAEKIKQILRNFISNALKFTEKGKTVTIGVRKTDDTKMPVEIYVKDEGIGIPEDKIDEVFEAFRQVDSSTSRKYGGTGLGLAITKKLSRLLGGDVRVSSKVGIGSTFTIALPLKIDTSKIDKKLIDIVEDSKDSEGVDKESKLQLNTLDAKIKSPISTIRSESMQDKNSDTILVIEDDETFANVLKEEIERLGYNSLRAHNGLDGIKLAASKQPMGIILDINLPLMDGWDVVKELKKDLKTRHIPIKVISADDSHKSIKKLGVVDFIQKPISTKQLDNIIDGLVRKAKKDKKDLLIIEDDPVVRDHLQELIGDKIDTNIKSVKDAKEAVDAVKEKEYDCAIVDIGLPDMDGFKLLEIVRRYDCNLPVIVYSSREFSVDEIRKLREYSESIVLKTAQSEARLLDEATLFLHRLSKNLNKNQKRMLQQSLQEEIHFNNKKVLMVDDDIRNIFSMTTLLEDYGLKITPAYNGKEAVELIKKESFDIILMDIMMPVMDGYEAIKEIRKKDSYKNTPIIALTAKSQKDEKSKCLNVGASDYMSKPIDSDELVRLIKIWLK